MDIEGAKFEAFQDILNHHKNITGIVFELHLNKKANFPLAVELLLALRENFILLHLHGNNFKSARILSPRAIGGIPLALELTYIHKSLVDKYHVSENQLHPLEIDMKNDPDKPEVRFEIPL